VRGKGKKGGGTKKKQMLGSSKKTDKQGKVFGPGEMIGNNVEKEGAGKGRAG